jgi:conjugal transfer ATP-binding protein TraC
MEGIARRARKYGANLVLGTQSINDFYKTPATIAVIENSDWSILLSQKAESISMLESSGKIALKEKPELKEALLSLRKVEGQFSEAIIYGPKGWAIGRLILDKYSLSLYSSTASDWSRINELKGQGYELAEALAQLANEKTKSSKLKLLNPADYRLVIDMTKKEEDRISYEDAFEMVVEKKIQMNFPIAYQEIYSQETMRLQ